MSRFVLEHRHAPHECRVVYAAWNGHPSYVAARTTAIRVMDVEIP